MTGQADKRVHPSADTNEHRDDRIKRQPRGHRQLDLSVPLLRRALTIRRALTLIHVRPQACAALQDFLAAGGNPETVMSHAGYRERLLLVFVENDWLDGVAAVLAAGADINADNGHALQRAAEHGHLSIVEHLLAAGADVHADDDAALWLAARKGNIAIMESLLGAGADVHSGKEWPLQVALRYSQPAAAAYLLAAGADAVVTWEQCEQRHETGAADILEAVAADIPPQQCAALIAMSPHRFPALRALRAAEQRRSVRQKGTPDAMGTPKNMPAGGSGRPPADTRTAGCNAKQHRDLHP